MSAAGKRSQGSGAHGGFEGKPRWAAAGRPKRRGPSAGAAALMLLLPATTLHLLLAVRSGPARLLGPPAHLPGLSELWSPRVLLLLLTWLGLQAALYLLPARKVWAPFPGEGEGIQRERRRPNPSQVLFALAGGGGVGVEGQESPALSY